MSPSRFIPVQRYAAMRPIIFFHNIILLALSNTYPCHSFKEAFLILLLGNSYISVILSKEGVFIMVSKHEALALFGPYPFFSTPIGALWSVTWWSGGGGIVSTLQS